MKNNANQKCITRCPERCIETCNFDAPFLFGGRFVRSRWCETIEFGLFLLVFIVDSVIFIPSFYENRCAVIKWNAHTSNGHLAKYFAFESKSLFAHKRTHNMLIIQFESWSGSGAVPPKSHKKNVCTFLRFDSVGGASARDATTLKFNQTNKTRAHIKRTQFTQIKHTRKTNEIFSIARSLVRHI